MSLLRPSCNVTIFIIGHCVLLRPACRVPGLKGLNFPVHSAVPTGRPCPPHACPAGGRPVEAVGGAPGRWTGGCWSDLISHASGHRLPTVPSHTSAQLIYAAGSPRGLTRSIDRSHRARNMHKDSNDCIALHIWISWTCGMCSNLHKCDFHKNLVLTTRQITLLKNLNAPKASPLYSLMHTNMT